MPRYLFNLYSRLDSAAQREEIEASDDRDAEDLARMRMLLTREYAHATVHRGNVLVADLTRDSGRS